MSGPIDVNERSLPLWGVLALALFLASCGSQAGYDKFRVYPVKDNARVVQGGASFMALRIEIPAGSYIYANPKGPGTGKPTEVRAIRDDSFIFKPAQYLPSEKYIAPGEDKSAFTWIYKDQTTIFIPFEAKDSAKPGDYKVKIALDSVMCNSSTCTQKDYTFVHTVTVLPAGSSDTTDKALAEEFGLSQPPAGMEERHALLSKRHSQGEVYNKEYTPDYLENEYFEPVFPESSNIGSIVQAVLFGFIAGFILNFMPCVLPVVSLKVLSLVGHTGKTEKGISLPGLVFSAGILTSFTLLAMLAAFFGYSWGGLFQHQWFIVVMASVIFVLGLSMFEVFVINPPSFVQRASRERGNPYADAFFKGLLATLLATPCSGPFLGGTLAWALSRPPLTVFIIYMSIGAGMALPYLILTMNPNLLRFVPRPGAWMRDFENIMGFALMFTVVYLLGILSDDFVLPTLLFLVFLCVAFWQYGRFGSIVQHGSRRVLSSIALVVIIASGYFISFDYIYREPVVDMPEDREFSLKEVYDNKDALRTSIILFTADWCPNCKLVERLSLHTPRVSKAIRDNDIDLMVADITRGSSVAERLLYKLGSRSIPFLAVMPAGQAFYRPVCLRDMYSQDDVLNAIETARNNGLKCLDRH